ncbi:MAG: alpha/beta hydrolase, partial [Nocardioides sp.]|nr:alpha/beta hydrolase [Nocardioides sp.]
VHGALPGSGGANGWRFMLPALAEAGFRVYAPDRPGFGLADTRPQYHPVRGMMSWVDFVGDFADALALDTFLLGGNSQGAQVAATYAVNHPERVEKLAMIASGGLSGPLEIPEDQLRPGVPFPQWQGTVESMREVLATIIHRPETLTDDLMRARTAAATLQRESWAAGMAWSRRARTEPDLQQQIRLKDRLDRLSIPMIYLYGRQDVMGPVENAYLQEDRLPNVQMFYPDDCGHQGQTDQPEMFNAVFTEFFRDGKVSAKTAEWAGVSTRRPVLPHLVESVEP